MATAFILFGALFFLGHVLKWFFYRTKVPDLLILVILGQVLGPVTGLVQPDSLGDVGRFLAEMALVVILLEGGIGLSLALLRQASWPALKVTLGAFVLSAPLAALIIKGLTDLPWAMAAYAGVALGSTSSAIVIPMVRFLSVGDKTRTILTLESAINDILVIVLGLVVLEVAAQGRVSSGEVLAPLLPVIAVSCLVGILAGLGLAFAKWNLPPFSGIKFSTEVSVCLLYGLSGLLGLNGAIAVLCLGLTLGNLTAFPSFLRRYFKADSAFGQGELELLAELAFLLKVFFFLYLGLLIRWESPTVLGIALLVTLVIYVTRYGVTRLCVAPREGKLDALTIFAMGPRGLAAAVVAGLPLTRGMAQGELVQSIVFATIPFTILTTALLVFAAERFTVALPLFRSYRGGERASSETPGSP